MNCSALGPITEHGGLEKKSGRQHQNCVGRRRKCVCCGRGVCTCQVAVVYEATVRHSEGARNKGYGPGTRDKSIKVWIRIRIEQDSTQMDKFPDTARQETESVLRTVATLWLCGLLRYWYWLMVNGGDSESKLGT